MLRRWLVGLSALALIIVLGMVAAGFGGLTPVLVWAGIQAAIVFVAILAERGRYRPMTTGAAGWVRTQERFQDPTSQNWIAVEFNPRTGERRYVSMAWPDEISPPPS
jgi:hypothetical protein